MTHIELIAALEARKGMNIIGLVAEVDTRIPKRAGLGNVRKGVRTVAMVGADYGRAVERQSGGEFTPEPLPWGEWYLPGKVISHKGEFYLRTQTRPGNRRKQPARLLYYRNEDGFLARDTVRPHLPAPSRSGRQETVGLLDVGEQVWVRTYAFASIRKVRIAGKTYTLTA